MTALPEKVTHSLLSPPILKLVAYSLLLTALCFGLMFGCVTWLVAYFTEGTTGLIASWATGIGSFVLSFFLFPFITPLIASFFTDAAMETIERQDYPSSTAQARPLWQEVKEGIRFFGVTLGLNLLCLPLYLIPVINLITFYTLNSYLFGREYFTMVAARHLQENERRQRWRSNRRTLVMAGGLIAFISTVPILNLAAPLAGIVIMTHLFHTVLQGNL